MDSLVAKLKTGSIVFLVILLGFYRLGLAEETNDYIHYQLGLKYKNENKLDQAIDEFRKLLTAYPDNYNAYMQLADIKRIQGQPRLVVFNLKKALAYNPGWAKAQKMLADAYEQDKQYQNAIIEYQHYQQTCDPAELDTIQAKINKLVRKVNNEPEPASEPLAKDTAVSAASTEKTEVSPQAKVQENRTVLSATPKPRNTNVKIKDPEPQTAGAFFQKAIFLYDEGKYNEALPLLKKAVSLQKNYSGAFYYAGLIRYKLGEIDLAKTNFTKSFSYPEGASMAHYYLGKILGTEKNYKEAIPHLLEFVSSSAESEARKEAIALLEHYKQITGDKTPLPEAASDSAAKVRKRPSRPVTETVAQDTQNITIEMRIDSLMSMAVADTLTDAGQAMLVGVRAYKAMALDSAIKEFKKVMVAYPAKTVAPQCLYNIGVCYMKLGLFSNAENQFEQILARFPAHFLCGAAMFFKAYSYLERGETGTAEKLLRSFLQTYRNHAFASRAYEKLGDIYTDLHQPGKAIDAYSQAASQAKNPADKSYAMFKLATAYSDAGNGQRSREIYNKIIDYGEQNGALVRVPDSYYRIADGEYKAKNYKAALDMYLKATRKYPTYQETPWGLFQTGNIYKTAKDYQKAIETFKQLARTFPDDYWAKQAKWKMDDAVWENEYRSVLE